MGNDRPGCPRTRGDTPIRRLIPLFALLSVGACVEYRISSDDDDTTDPAPEEVCSGEDNDGDGEVDEGFGDGDGDGIADCVDDACDVELPAVEFIEVDSDCTVPYDPPDAPWSVVVEWQYPLLDMGGAKAMPAVGQLDDDDGNGRIDEADTPDIVIVTNAASSWRSGVTGRARSSAATVGSTSTEESRLRTWIGMASRRSSRSSRPGKACTPSTWSRWTGRARAGLRSATRTTTRSSTSGRSATGRVAMGSLPYAIPMSTGHRLGPHPGHRRVRPRTRIHLGSSRRPPSPSP